MNKTKTIIIAIGGVSVVISLALAYLAWDAFSAKGENDERLSRLAMDVNRIASAKIYPSNQAIKDTEAIRASYDEWRDDASIVINAGDKVFEPTTPPAFKTFLVGEASRLASLPGEENGKLVKEGFTFGFSEYIAGGVLPAEKDLPRLQREWLDVSTVVGLLADSGVASIDEITLKKAAVEAPVVEKGKKPKKPKKNIKKQDKEEKTSEVTTFTINYQASPESLVKSLNALCADPRFIVVESLSFSRAEDAINDKIGGTKKAETTNRRGRRTREQAEATDSTAKTGVVIDPRTVAPFKVIAKISVYDFCSAAKAASEQQKEEAK